MTETEMAMSTETPARYWAVNTMYIRDVQTKIDEKACIKSSVFFCRQDPQLLTFRLDIDFGGEVANHLSVYVRPLTQDVPDMAISISLSDDDGNTITNHKSETLNFIKNEGRGFNREFKLSRAANESWRVVCEVQYKASLPMKPPNETCNKTLHDDLLKLLESSENADVTFLVKGGKIKAHKAILAARSTYFKRMFASGMEETVSKKVDIQDAEPDIITGMLQYMYSGLPPKNLTVIAMGLLAISDKYGLDELKQICESNICSNLTAKTVVDALLLAERHNCEDLMTRAKIVFRTNIGAIKQSKQDREKLRSHDDLLWKLFELLDE